MNKEIKSPVIPQHQWTHASHCDGKKVLLVKCVDAHSNGFGAFVWPKSGQVKPNYCSTEKTCKSGGLFGWPWGINIGGGKEPNYRGFWIVFAAPAEQVIDLGNKSKVAA